MSNGSSLDEQNNNGHSIFLSAANGGRVRIVEWLLAKGFSLQETNNNGDTALLLAAYGGHIPLVEWSARAFGVHKQAGLAPTTLASFAIGRGSQSRRCSIPRTRVWSCEASLLHNFATPTLFMFLEKLFSSH